MKILPKIIENQTGAMGWILLWAIGFPCRLLMLFWCAVVHKTYVVLDRSAVRIRNKN